MAPGSHNKRLRDYTSVPFEIFIVTFTVLPFFLLAYFYPVLSDRVPLFMKLNREVAVWAEKSVATVFRLPLLAVVTQVLSVDEIPLNTICRDGACFSGAAVLAGTGLHKSRIRQVLS